MKTNSIIYIVTGIVVLVGVFFLVRLNMPNQNTNDSATTNSTTNAPTEDTKVHTVPIAKTFDLVIKEKKVVSGQTALAADQYAEVTINVTADEDEELHLHGYDKTLVLVKDQPATLTFFASLSGRFPFELEKSKTELGALEVQPQ